MNTMNLSRIFIASILASVIVGCATEETVFDPHALQSQERREAKAVQPQPMRPLPTTLESPFLPTRTSGGPASRPTTQPTTGAALGTEPVVRLSLEELVRRSAVNSLGVRVAGYDPAVRGATVVEEEGRFDPRFFTNTAFERRNNLTGGVTNPLNFELINQQKANITTVASGVRQQLESGGQAELRYETSRNDYIPAQTVLNPYWQNNLVLEVTQPLLRGLGNEITHSRITLARNEQRISFLDFRKTLEQNLADMERTYWQLVVAEQDVKIQENLLQQTIDTASLLAKRGAQDVTRVQTSQANAAVESRRAVLIRSKARVRDFSDQIKRLMNDPGFPITANNLILPATSPNEEPIHFVLSDQIDTALFNRLELAQQLLRIDSAGTRVKVAKNNLLPSLNLIGSLGAQGLGKDFSNAVDTQDDFNHINYKVGLELEVPIGNRAPRAAYQRELLLRQQEIDRYRDLIEQVSLDVRTAVREVQTTWDEMVTTRQARFATADSLRAIQLREENNEPLTPTFVQLKLDTQERLANAWRAEVEAVGNYNVAIANLERVKGTLLKYDNVIMAEDSTIPFVAKKQ